MKKHERTFNLESKLIASEASDDQFRREFKKLAEELEAESFTLREYADRVASVMKKLVATQESIAHDFTEEDWLEMRRLTIPPV